MVPDYDYITKTPEGDISQINGTSAAVGIIVGLAALWCEKLIKSGNYPYPMLLKAILLSTSLPSGVDYSRIVNPSKSAIFTDNIYYENISLLPGRASIFDVFVNTETDITIAFVPNLPNNKVIESCNQIFELSICSDGESPITVTSDTYLVHDISKNVKKMRLQLSTSDSSIEGFLVINGTKNVTKQTFKPSGRNKPLTIVGISASHDASACLMQNGEIKAAIQLERISRIKRDGQGYLSKECAIHYCLESLGLKEKDVDYFAFNSQPLMPEYYGLSQPTHDNNFQLFNPFDKNCIYVSHHLAHAFSAFFSSSFQEAAVYVADGSGGSTIGSSDLILFGNELNEYLNQSLSSPPPLHVESSYLFTKKKFELIDRRYARSFNVRCGSDSLGEVYAAVSQLIFGDWQDGGKLMGLAPYGNADDYGPTLLACDKDGILNFTHAWKNNHRNVMNKLDPMAYKHLAARIQQDLELALIQRFQILRQKLPLVDHAAYAGGLALNCVANEKLMRTSNFKDIFIHPASNDAGISVGAAAAAHFHLTGEASGSPMKHVFYGHSYHQNDYLNAVSTFKNFINSQKIDTAEIANHLAQGKIYGIFEKSCEFGPRALGHRSIVADSRNKDTWQFINRWIKFREDFRPFAPAVPVEHADNFFETNQMPSPYMLRAVRVRDEFQDKLGAVTHLNGLARIQTVDKEILPRFHGILTEFGNVTGIPVLVNTSLNVRGQPLVETPEQAIEMLLCTHLNGIIFEDTLITVAYDIEDVVDASLLAFAPDMRLNSETQGHEIKMTFSTNYRNKKIILEAWQYTLLSCLHSKPSLAQLRNIASGLNVDESIWMPWLKSLIRLRYIHLVKY